jgi:hypothetical protein
MLSNPLDRVIFRNKALDYFRFAIGPQNIDPPARTGIFPRRESWSLVEHPLNNAPVTARFKTGILPDQTDRQPELQKADRRARETRWCGSDSRAAVVPAERRQLNGESPRSAACLCFCGAAIATVDEHIRSAHRGVGA